MLPDEEDGPGDPISGEPSDLEPEEYDPEAELYDPESGSLTVPQVEIPEVETSESEAPREVKIAFWSVVLVVNAALLAVSLGVMFAVFTGNLRRAGGLVVGGLVLFGMAYRRYRRFMDEEGASEEGDTKGGGDAEDGSDAEAETDSNPGFEATDPNGSGANQ